MKGKIPAIALVLILISVSSSAQVRIGIRGGLNASRLNNDKEFVTPNPTLQSHYRITVPNYIMVGYHLGLIGRIQIASLYIQPEALYTVTRNDINVYDLNSANPEVADEVTQKLNKVEFPVILGLKLSAFRLGAGPVLTFLISDDSDLKKITQYDMQLNKATIGYQAGIGFDIKKLAIDIKYEGSLSKLSDGINIGNNEKIAFDSRISQIIVSAGIFF